MHYLRLVRAENPERRPRENAAARRRGRRPRTPEYAVKFGIYRRHWGTGFTQELVDALHVLQDGKCAICSVVLNKVNKLKCAQGETADHFEPSPGVKVPRGLLCKMCNLRLGTYEKHLKPDGAVYPRFDAYITNYPTLSLRREPEAAE